MLGKLQLRQSAGGRRSPNRSCSNEPAHCDAQASAEKIVIKRFRRHHFRRMATLMQQVFVNPCSHGTRARSQRLTFEFKRVGCLISKFA